MALRANVLAKGFSGIRLDTLEALVALLNRARASASCRRADRSARAAISRRSRIWRSCWSAKGEATIGDGPGPSARRASALARAGLAPVALGPKEGLALINGTQASTAVLALALRRRRAARARRRHRGALSIDALRGSIHPFEARIHAARPFRGQMTSAANIERLLRGQRHQRVARALRQRAGRVLAALRGRRCTARRATRIAFARRTVEIEANAATDNPMVFADTGDIVSGGNFHGAPIAIAADLLAAAHRPARHDQRAAHRSARRSER